MNIAAVLGLCLLSVGCATKAYVAKSIAPVDARVTAAEAKNGEQDTKIAANSKDIDELGRDLSRTKERVNDADSKATAAGEAAKAASEQAKLAGDKADGAQRAADGARSFAQSGLTQLAQTVDAMNHYQMLKTETVLFPVNRWVLNPEAKVQLSELAKSAEGLDRYVIEVQGFTDRTGPMALNERLSEQRAQEVARFLANEYKIPLRSISMLGSGPAQPVGDDKTREGRKMNRRVEVRLFVPEAATAAKPTTKADASQR